MWSTLVDFYLCRNKSIFLQLEELRGNVGLGARGSKNLKVRQETSHRCNTVEVKQLLLKREDLNFKEKRFPQWRTWETSDCLHGRSDDRGVRLFQLLYYV